MSRDELIEELKKAPANGEVLIRWFEKELRPKEGYVLVRHDTPIDKIDTIPGIIIEAEWES
jgi:hypothetical protein